MPNKNKSSRSTSGPSRARSSRAADPSPERQHASQMDTASDMSTHATGVNTGAETTDGPSYDEIAEAAYHRYLSRGGEGGRDFDDWVEAERELRSRRSRTEH